MVIETVVDGKLYWAINPGFYRIAVLREIHTSSVFNIPVAEVNRPKDTQDYEAVLLRGNQAGWSLGVYDNLDAAKDAVIATLVTKRLEK